MIKAEDTEVHTCFAGDDGPLEYASQQVLRRGQINSTRTKQGRIIHRQTPIKLSGMASAPGLLPWSTEGLARKKSQRHDHQ